MLSTRRADRVGQGSETHSQLGRLLTLRRWSHRRNDHIFGAGSGRLQPTACGPVRDPQLGSSFAPNQGSQRLFVEIDENS
jgi:hypothetical protein